MLILRDPALANRIADPDIRFLVELRFTQVCAGQPYDYDEHGYMIVVEPGDDVAALEKESGCAILYEPFDDVPYGHPDFTPSFDILEEHDHAYEILYISNDNGFATTIIVPKDSNIDACLLAMCAQYAQPAIEVDAS